MSVLKKKDTRAENWRKHQIFHLEKFFSSICNFGKKHVQYNSQSFMLILKSKVTFLFSRETKRSLPFHGLQNINSLLIMSIYGDKYWRRIVVEGNGCRTILTNHEDNTLARTIRSILVSRVHNHVTWILYTQALLLFLPCLWLRIATCYLLYRSSSSSLSSFSTLYNWHTIVRMRIRIDDMPLCTRYESTYETRIDAPCPERSPRNFSMPHHKQFPSPMYNQNNIYSKRIFQMRKIFHCAFDRVIQFRSISLDPILSDYIDTWNR